MADTFNNNRTHKYCYSFTLEYLLHFYISKYILLRLPSIACLQKIKIGYTKLNVGDINHARDTKWLVSFFSLFFFFLLLL